MRQKSIETKAPPHRVRRCGPQPISGFPEEAMLQKQPEQAGIRAKPQRERRNAKCSGSVETQGDSCETTAGASKRRPRRTAVAARNLSGPPRRGQKRPGAMARNQNTPEQARRGRNSRETTAGASKRNGIRAKPQRERRNATQFARNHRSVETKAPPHRVHRCGPQPISGSPRRGQNTPEEAGIRAKPQREHRNATELSKRNALRPKPQRGHRNELGILAVL